MDTQCYEVTVQTTPEQADFISDLLMGAGSLGVSMSIDEEKKLSHRILAYFPVTESSSELKGRLVNQLKTAGVETEKTKVTIEVIEEADWQNQWKDYYHAQDVTRWLRIVPEWEQTESASDRLTIYLDPETTFGTGYHPTTRLALGMLGDELTPGETVIDVGTGSGVLAIIADLLGASQVYAYDNDPACEGAVAHNLALNPKASHTTFQVSNMLTDSSEIADIVVANILAEVLLPLIPQVTDHLSPGGKLILSGIYYDQYENIKSKLDEYDFEIIESRKRGEWFSILAMKKDQPET